MQRGYFVRHMDPDQLFEEAQTGIPVANLFGLVISAHSGFRIKLSASLTTRILGLMGW
jgi:hypothetical protein